MVCVKADFVKGTDFLEVFVNYLDMFRVEAFPLEAFLEPNDAPHIQAELERRVSFARENEGVAGPAKKWVAAHMSAAESRGQTHPGSSILLPSPHVRLAPGRDGR